ncbi:MAG: ATP-binding protein [Patescibacteria group bacterium]
MESIQIKGNGVKSVLRKFNRAQSFAEYVWNGFDAGAKSVNINFKTDNIFDSVNEISISDDGSGIPYQLLEGKFKPFFESEKARLNDPQHRSLPHGKNGIGRLTFYTFAREATWETIYSKNDKKFSYTIKITQKSLENYEGSHDEQKEVATEKTGTTVVFRSIEGLTPSIIRDEIVDFLKTEFCWFLESKKTAGFSLKINGVDLDYDDIVNNKERIDLVHPDSGTKFSLNFIQWTRHLSKEYSRWYLIDSNGMEKWKNATRLNNKGDNFFHSVFVSSSYFDDFIYDPDKTEEDKTLFGHSKGDPEFKYLLEELNRFLYKKRKPFLKNSAIKLIKNYETEGIIPKFKEPWELPRKDELETLIRGLYEIQPRLFSSSSIEQKRTFVLLLNALLDSEDREQLLDIINNVLELSREDRTELVELLKVTKLSGIISTIKLIKERYKTIDQVKELVFNPTLKANERDHLQKIIDAHYWIFGEKYNLVSSTEIKFQKVLESYLHLLGIENKAEVITHVDRNKEMDIFLCRQNISVDTIENVVVELKSPTVPLGENELSQVKRYMSVILSAAQFNANNMQWDFILIGNKFDTSGFIQNEIKNAESHGEKSKGLAFKTDRYRIYVRTWSEVLNDVGIRHDFLQKRLELDRNKLTKDYVSADDVVIDAGKNLETVA